MNIIAGMAGWALRAGAPVAGYYMPQSQPYRHGLEICFARLLLGRDWTFDERVAGLGGALPTACEPLLVIGLVAAGKSSTRGRGASLDSSAPKVVATATSLAASHRPPAVLLTTSKILPPVGFLLLLLLVVSTPDPRRTATAAPAGRNGGGDGRSPPSPLDSGC